MTCDVIGYCANMEQIFCDTRDVQNIGKLFYFTGMKWNGKIADAMYLVAFAVNCFNCLVHGTLNIGHLIQVAHHMLQGTRVHIPITSDAYEIDLHCIQFGCILVVAIISHSKVFIA